MIQQGGIQAMTTTRNTTTYGYDKFASFHFLRLTLSIEAFYFNSNKIYAKLIYGGQTLKDS